MSADASAGAARDGDAVDLKVQVVLDCADPHAQAEFWAEALGLEVVRTEEMIRELLAAGVATDDDVIERNGELVWKTGAAAEDPRQRLPRMFFQLVPEATVPTARTDKPPGQRIHLDLHVGEENRASEVARLTALGAVKLYDGQLGPQTWVTMADPEGNAFCVA